MLANERDEKSEGRQILCAERGFGGGALVKQGEAYAHQVCPPEGRARASFLADLSKYILAPVAQYSELFNRYAVTGLKFTQLKCSHPPLLPRRVSKLSRSVVTARDLQ